MPGNTTAGGVLPQVWDLRKFKAPLRVFGGLPNLMSTTGACFSPDDRLAITGTSAGRDGTGATLVFVDLAKEAVVRRIGMPGNVVALNWHSRLNQIFVGTGAPMLSPSILQNLLPCCNEDLFSDSAGRGVSIDVAGLDSCPLRVHYVHRMSSCEHVSHW